MTSMSKPSKRNTKANYAELRNRLSEMFLQYQQSLNRYQWPVESMRWNELVYCVLEALGTDLSARTAAKVMGELNLLGVDKVAELKSDDAGKATSLSRLVSGILKEAGFADASARQAVSVLGQTARKVKYGLDGNIQELLRREGERMIQNTAAFMEVTGLDKKLARQIVTRWLQNVLNLPVYLDNESERAFCAELKMSPKELVAAADDLDINVALVDDMVQEWYKSKLESRRLSQEIGSLPPGRNKKPAKARPPEVE